MQAINTVFTGGVYLTSSLKTISFSLILSVSMVKHFIIQDDKPIVDKILLGIEQVNRTDKKIALCKIKFNLSACKELSKKEIDSLSETARNFFLFRSSVRNKTKTSKLCQYLDG